MAKAVCTLYGTNGTIHGSLLITQAQEDAKSIISGTLSDLPPGNHGFHVNVYGDIRQNGTSTGGVFNPFGKNHGAPSDEDRRTGSLGNIQVSPDGTALVNMEDHLVKLIGPHSIIGRSLVLHENEDDMGKGGHELSLQNGNAGAIIAYGVVGIST